MSSPTDFEPLTHLPTLLWCGGGGEWCEGSQLATSRDSHITQKGQVELALQGQVMPAQSLLVLACTS